MMLNAPISGPQAWLLLAIRRGYLADAGIDLDLIPGTGAYNAAPEHVRQECDLSHGDIYSLAEVWAADPQSAPIACYATFRRSAAAIAVPEESSICSPADLRGATILGHASDVGLRTFPAYAAQAKLKSGDVNVAHSDLGFVDLFHLLRQGDGRSGVFGYVSTITAALAGAGVDADTALRWLRFSGVAPDLYGSALMLSRSLAAAEPHVCSAFVAAVDRGMREAVTDPEAAMDAVASFGAKASRETDMIRWMTSLREEFAPRPGDALPLGRVDPARLTRSLRAHAKAVSLPRIPTAADLFTDAFLP